MKTAWIIRHLAFEGPGLLQDVLAAKGYRTVLLDAGIDAWPALEYRPDDLLVILGGPIGAHDDADYPWLADELALIRGQLARNAPLLGICLGAQLIARAMGGHSAPMGYAEIGYDTIQLAPQGAQSVLAAADGCKVLHWHGDQFSIPPGAQWLASSERCPHQAFALGRKVLALQFHLETDWRELERWLLGHFGELRANGIDIPQLRRDAAQYGPALAGLAATVFGRWLDELEDAR